MLHPDPSLRASLKDVESYRWVNQKVDPTLYDYDSMFGEFQIHFMQFYPFYGDLKMSIFLDQKQRLAQCPPKVEGYFTDFHLI